MIFADGFTTAAASGCHPFLPFASGRSRETQAALHAAAPLSPPRLAPQMTLLLL